MDRAEQTRAMVRKYYDSLVERGTGKERYLALQPGVSGRLATGPPLRTGPGLSVTRLVADGSTAAASSNFTVGDERMVGVTFFELDGDLISRVTDFWPEPYEPPAGRGHLVERRTGEVDPLLSFLVTP